MANHPTALLFIFHGLMSHPGHPRGHLKEVPRPYFKHLERCLFLFPRMKSDLALSFCIGIYGN